MADTKQIGVRVSPELYEAIEDARGRMSREAWMRLALAKVAEEGLHPPYVLDAAKGTIARLLPESPNYVVGDHHPRCVCAICKP